MKANNPSKQPQRKSQTFRPKDWLVIGGGSILVIALVVFVLIRKNQRVPSQAATGSATAQAVAPGAVDHEHDETATVRRISNTDLRSAMDRGEAVVIDVRDLDSYKAGHIAGSYQIPVSAVENEVQYLPRGKMIVTYCT